jgi:hypothetical protein
MIRALVIAIFTVISLTVAPCSCPPNYDVIDLAKFDAVFVGRVMELRLRENEDIVATFEICKVWKGHLGESASVVTRNPCGYDFQLGSFYFVFVKGGWTGLCTPTSSYLKNTSATLSILGQPTYENPNAKLPQT